MGDTGLFDVIAQIILGAVIVLQGFVVGVMVERYGWYPGLLPNGAGILFCFATAYGWLTLDSTASVVILTAGFTAAMVYVCWELFGPPSRQRAEVKVQIEEFLDRYDIEEGDVDAR